MKGIEMCIVDIISCCRSPQTHSGTSLTSQMKELKLPWALFMMFRDFQLLVLWERISPFSHIIRPILTPPIIINKCCLFPFHTVSLLLSPYLNWFFFPSYLNWYIFLSLFMMIMASVLFNEFLLYFHPSLPPAVVTLQSNAPQKGRALVRPWCCWFTRVLWNRHLSTIILNQREEILSFFPLCLWKIR